MNGEGLATDGEVAERYRVSKSHLNRVVWGCAPGSSRRCAVSTITQNRAYSIICAVEHVTVASEIVLGPVLVSWRIAVLLT